MKSDSYSKVGVRIEPVYATSFAILDLNICEPSRGVIENVKVVNDQLRRTIICRQFNLNATHDGNWCAVLDVVVRGIAFIVMNRES